MRKRNTKPTRDFSPPKNRQGQHRAPRDDDELFEYLENKCDEIIKGIMIGLSYNAACRAAGVNPATYYLWRQKANAGIVPYDKIIAKINNAKAIGERTLAGRVFKASENDWRAAMAILERRHRKRWGKDAPPVDSGKKKDPDVSSPVEEMTYDERIARIKELQARIAKASTRVSNEGEAE